MYKEEEDILHAIENGYQYDGLHPEDWAEILFRESDLFTDWPIKLRVEFIRYMAAHEKFRPLILDQLNSFL